MIMIQHMDLKPVLLRNITPTIGYDKYSLFTDYCWLGIV